jgi:hypothetical protein
MVLLSEAEDIPRMGTNGYVAVALVGELTVVDFGPETITPNPEKFPIGDHNWSTGRVLNDDIVALIRIGGKTIAGRKANTLPPYLPCLDSGEAR